MKLILLNEKLVQTNRKLDIFIDMYSSKNWLLQQAYLQYRMLIGWGGDKINN